MYTQVVSALSLLSITGATTVPKCQTQSQPNPIAGQYLQLTTGTINGTIAILPITFNLARSIIPSQYGILVNGYRSFLPSLWKGLYRAMLQIEFDHDIKNSGVSIPDFTGFNLVSLRRSSHDGYTAMTYGSQILLTATNVVGIAGARAYGNIVTPVTFEPACDAYQYASSGTDGGPRQTQFAAYAALGSALSSIGLGPISHVLHTPTNGETSPYTIDFWKNVTNQPQFSDIPLVCDNFIRLFNSSVTMGKYEPTPVKGHVPAVKPYFAKSTVFKDVWVYNLTTPSSRTITRGVTR